MLTAHSLDSAQLGFMERRGEEKSGAEWRGEKVREEEWDGWMATLE